MLSNRVLSVAGAWKRHNLYGLPYTANLVFNLENCNYAHWLNNIGKLLICKAYFVVLYFIDCNSDIICILLFPLSIGITPSKYSEASSPKTYQYLLYPITVL